MLKLPWLTAFQARMCFIAKCDTDVIENMQFTTLASGWLSSHPSLTLAKQDVADSSVHVIIDGVSTVDHQTVHKLHGLGPLAPELAGHDHLTALSTALHDEAENTIAGPEEDNGPVNHGVRSKKFQAMQTEFILTLLRQMPRCLQAKGTCHSEELKSGTQNMSTDPKSRES